MIDISQVRFQNDIVGFQNDLVQVIAYYSEYKGYANKIIPLAEHRKGGACVEAGKKDAFANLEKVMKHRLIELMGIFPEVISEEIKRQKREFDLDDY